MKVVDMNPMIARGLCRRSSPDTFVNLKIEDNRNYADLLRRTIHASAGHLAVVCENFFKGKGGKIDGLNCHTIEFYYYMNILDNGLDSCKNMTDEGEELVWLPINKRK